MNRRFRLEQRFNSSDVSLFTLFVDKLPYDVGPIWFRSFFSNFGFVKRSFIPNKVSRRSGCRFGFVSFGSREEADLAIEKSNGIWIDNRKLFVKKASFSLNPNPHITQNPIPQRLQSKPLTDSKPSFFDPQPHFFSNPQPQPQQTSKPSHTQGFNTSAEKRITIKVQPIASSWLSNCSVVKLKNPCSPEMIVKALQMAGISNIEVKSMGGLYMLLIFISKDERNNALSNPTLKDWFVYFKPWNGEPASLSRFVWLKCSGVPIQAWNTSTFRRIGESWGDFINLDEETMKELSYDIGRMLITTEYERSIDEWINILINGRNYRVKVWEEPCDDPFAVIFKTQVNIGIQTGASLNSVINSQDKNNNSNYGADLESIKDPHTTKEEAVKKDASTDMESKFGAQVDLNTDEEAFSNNLVGGPISINKTAVDRDSMCSSLGTEIYSVGSDNVPDSLEESQSQLKNSSRLVYQDSKVMMNNPLVADGSGKEKLIYNDDKEVEFPMEEQNANVTNEEDQNLDHFEANQIPIQAAIKGIKGKRNRKSINEILGYTKVNAGNTNGRRNKKKCVVLRSAIASAALSASISSGNINNRNRILLDEAQAIWEVDKLFGISYQGDEAEVVSKLAEMEALNKARVVDYQ